MNETLSYEMLLNAYHDQVEKYNTLIDTSPDGILLLKAVRNTGGIIIDFSIEHCNRAGTILGDIPCEAVGYKTLLEVLPHLKNSDQFKIHTQVIETGQPVQFETTFRDKHGKEYGWFIVSLMKVGDAVFSRFIDISEKKENELKFMNQAAFYTGILETSINGVIACEAIRNNKGKIVDFKILKVNKAFTEMTQKPANEAEGKSFLAIFPNAQYTTAFDIYCKVVETGVSIRVELQSETGSGKWYDIAVARITYNTIAVTFTNITKRMSAYEELEKQRNLLDNILQHSPSGIAVSEMIRDKDGKITDARVIMVNDITEKLTGISKETSLKKTIKEVDPLIVETGLFSLAAQTLSSGEPFRTQYFLSATNKWLELGVSKMDNNRLVNIYTDITEAKESQLKIERTIEMLKRTNASLEEFTYAASHDLKEPIRKIRIFAERLKDMHSANLDEQGHSILKKLLLSGERMSLLVNDLLEYSHVSLLETETELIDLNEKLQNILSDLEVEIEEKKAIVNIQHLPFVKGHRRQLQQLFQNIITNSLKYSHRSIPPVINISSAMVRGRQIKQDIPEEHKEKNFYLVQIVDNGIGFDQKDVEKIFRVFQRLHGRDQYHGSGVGLSIVKKVVENHRGYITASGVPDKGATFSIYLPVD